MTIREEIRYGTLPSQYAEIWSAGDQPVHGVAIMLHGGWWRARHSLHLMDDLCADLVGGGWFVVNMEYRRIDGDGGGWPQTLTDVLAGIEAVRATHLELAGLPTVAIGHSAGGHLALMASAHSSVSAVVALAPITDLARCAQEGLGEGATVAFMGALPDEEPKVYLRASPVHQLTSGRSQLVIHGDCDNRVPIEHSRDYVATARAAGDPVDYVEVVGTDHFQIIDARHDSWSHARQWLDRALPRPWESVPSQ
ncbi:MAG: prolyl oligopeptidase family serine peptidase [Streptomyces turgidiscabies]|nr:prolyl oligopeptidase family serine peptidase [Streptomyces turgidiscabies]